MTTIIEKNFTITVILVLASAFLIFLGAGLGLAYMGGVFTGKNEVIENDQRITNENLLKSAPSPAPEPAKP
jgi:hypothetical protein